MKDYYKVLGVPRSATAHEIKQAYRKLIKGCHPDVNSSPKAAEWSRELNNAYSILSDAEKKASYDMDLKLEESNQRDSTARQTTTSQTRTESRPPPRAEPNFCCEKCGKVDSSLRISAIWRVMSLIYWSRKVPIVKILCNKCRIKTSLAASAFTFFLGWWGIIGFFWTLEALFKNALGGEQPKENNSTLLRALSYQLYQIGHFGEAYKALAAALKFQPDSETEKILEQLKQQSQPSDQKTFWERFRDFELHPFYYHAPTGAVVIALIIISFNALNASSQSTTSHFDPFKDGGATRVSTPPSTPANPFIAAGAVPVFSEPELPLPEQGGLLYSESFANYAGTTAPFKLTTPSDGNYVMKIEDWNTKELVAMYFIPRSSTLQIELPLGSYRLKFAQGEKWYGMKYLFGPQTAYSYVPDKMDFYVSGDYARGQQIELIPQVNGNLDTPPMKAENW